MARSGPAEPTAGRCTAEHILSGAATLKDLNAEEKAKVAQLIQRARHSPA